MVINKKEHNSCDIEISEEQHSRFEKLWEKYRFHAGYLHSSTKGLFHVNLCSECILQLLEEHVKMKNILDRLGFTLEDLE